MFFSRESWVSGPGRAHLEALVQTLLSLVPAHPEPPQRCVTVLFLLQPCLHSTRISPAELVLCQNRVSAHIADNEEIQPYPA